MPTGSSPEPIEGKNWKAEVVDRRFEAQNIRNKFYQESAKLKLAADPNAVLNDPAKAGLKTFDDLNSASEFQRTVNPDGKPFETGKGWTLYECLDDYFLNNVGVTDKAIRRREVALCLYYLTQQKDTQNRSINVDYLNAKWNVIIKNGKLYIYNAEDDLIVDSANLRKPSAATTIELPEPAPLVQPESGPPAAEPGEGPPTEGPPAPESGEGAPTEGP